MGTPDFIHLIAEVYTLLPNLALFPPSLSPVTPFSPLFFFFDFVFFFFFFFRVAPAAYGSSQARGHVGAIATDLCHSHSNMGSEPCP